MGQGKVPRFTDLSPVPYGRHPENTEMETIPGQQKVRGFFSAKSGTGKHFCVCDPWLTAELWTDHHAYETNKMGQGTDLRNAEPSPVPFLFFLHGFSSVELLSWIQIPDIVFYNV